MDGWTDEVIMGNGDGTLRWKEGGLFWMQRFLDYYRALFLD